MLENFDLLMFLTHSQMSSDLMHAVADKQQSLTQIEINPFAPYHIAN